MKNRIYKNIYITNIKLVQREGFKVKNLLKESNRKIKQNQCNKVFFIKNHFKKFTILIMYTCCNNIRIYF